MVSPQAEVIFEDEQGEVENIFENDVPYDLDAPVIEIRPEDYGIWYVDMMDHPDKYKREGGRVHGQGTETPLLPLEDIPAGAYGNDLLCG